MEDRWTFESAGMINYFGKWETTVRFHLSEGTSSKTHTVDAKCRIVDDIIEVARRTMRTEDYLRIELDPPMIGITRICQILWHSGTNYEDRKPVIRLKYFRHPNTSPVDPPEFDCISCGTGNGRLRRVILDLRDGLQEKKIRIKKLKEELRMVKMEKSLNALEEHMKAIEEKEKVIESKDKEIEDLEKQIENQRKEHDLKIKDIKNRNRYDKQVSEVKSKYLDERGPFVFFEVKDQEKTTPPRPGVMNGSPGIGQEGYTQPNRTLRNQQNLQMNDGTPIYHQTRDLSISDEQRPNFPLGINMEPNQGDQYHSNQNFVGNYFGRPKPPKTSSLPVRPQGGMRSRTGHLELRRNQPPNPRLSPRHGTRGPMMNQGRRWNPNLNGVGHRQNKPIFLKEVPPEHIFNLNDGGGNIE